MIFLQVLNAYLEYMTKVGVLMGGEENMTRKHMQNVIAFETELANVSSSERHWFYVWYLFLCLQEDRMMDIQEIMQRERQRETERDREI